MKSELPEAAHPAGAAPYLEETWAAVQDGKTKHEGFPELAPPAETTVYPDLQVFSLDTQ